MWSTSHHVSNKNKNFIRKYAFYSLTEMKQWSLFYGLWNSPLIFYVHWNHVQFVWTVLHALHTKFNNSFSNLLHCSPSNKQSEVCTCYFFILTTPSEHFFFFHDMKNLITVIVIVQLGRVHRSVSDGCTRN